MDCSELIAELKAQASEKYKANVVRMGIPEQESIGVSTAVVRGIAKKLKKSNELALELWAAGYHEARLLAVLLMDPKSMEKDTARRLIEDVRSWDLCDHLCKNLLAKMDCKDEFIEEWITSSQTYSKRAAFALIATAAVHDKKLTDGMLRHYLELIAQHSDDDREHVRKAASWALREIGKRDFDYNEKALLLAHEFALSDSKAQKWIGKDARKELETLVKAEGRGRLVSSNSKMGRQAVNPISCNIFLIGFMGTGKSTISGCLGSSYGMEVAEMDQMIEEEEGMGIPEIFDTHGEEYFRGLETKLLAKLQEKRGVVISCGGGTPMRDENVALMKKSGKVVLLKASPETVYERVKDSHDRPLLEGNKNAAFIAELMEKRRAKYEAAADIAIQTDGKDEATICRELVRQLVEEGERE